MKRIFPLLVLVTMLYSLCVPAFATEDAADPAVSSEETSAETVTETVTTETVLDDKSVTINVVMPAAAETGTEEETSTEEEEAAAEEEISPEVAAYSTYSLDETETSDASLPAAIVALFGEYQPRTQTVTEYLSDGTEVTYQEYVPGLAGLDWNWIVSVSIFSLALYCIFRAIGGCLKWN